MTDIVRVAGLPETVTVSVTGGEDSMTVVGADVTVTVKVVSASPPCPPLPSMGITEYVGRAAWTSAAGVLLHIKGNANDEPPKEETPTRTDIGMFLRCILSAKLFGSWGDVLHLLRNKANLMGRNVYSSRNNLRDKKKKKRDLPVGQM